MGQFDIQKTAEEIEFENWKEFQTSRERFDFMKNEQKMSEEKWTQFSGYAPMNTQFDTDYMKTTSEREKIAYEQFKKKQTRFDAGYNG